MKPISSILCILALAIQVLLGAGVVVHSDHCHDHEVVVEHDEAAHAHHSCGCGHHHHEPPAPPETPEKDKEPSVEDTHHHPCYCKHYRVISADPLVRNQRESAPCYCIILNKDSSLSPLSYLKVAPSQAPPSPPDIGKHTYGDFVAVQFGAFIC